MATMFKKLAAQNKKKTKGFGKLLLDHPDSLDRRDTSLALIARFPEHEEYVISTSEFQRVEAHLLKTTSAKAGITGDFDEGDPGKPTLKRRQPDADGTTTDTTTGKSSSSDAPPPLKRRGTDDSTTTTTDTAKPNDSTTTTTTEKPPQLKRRGEPSPTPPPNQ